MPPRAHLCALAGSVVCCSNMRRLMNWQNERQSTRLSDLRVANSNTTVIGAVDDQCKTMALICSLASLSGG
eukprot:1590024-Alexandrium_andersonii.AAC.1